MLAQLRSLFAPLPDGPPQDSPTPEGVFHLCDQQQHVLTWNEARCPDCLASPPAHPAEPPLPPPPHPPLPPVSPGPAPTQALPIPPTSIDLLSLPPPPTRPPPRPERGTQVLKRADKTEADRPRPWGRLVLEWELSDPQVALGAAPGCTLSLAPLAGAGQLFTLRTTQGQVLLEPNPAHVVQHNGLPITTTTPLRGGDKLGVLGLTFRFERDR